MSDPDRRNLPPPEPSAGGLEQDSRAGGNSPRCVFVAGPRGSGKTRWLQDRLRQLVQEQPGIRCAVVLAEDGRTRMERFAHEVPGVAVRRVLLPCPCCPALAHLPTTVQDVVRETGAAWVFIEVPATAAAGLLGEFDREIGWAREVVVCLTPRWDDLRHKADAPVFLSALIERATSLVVTSPPTGAPAFPGLHSAGTPEVILS